MTTNASGLPSSNALITFPFINTLFRPSRSRRNSRSSLISSLQALDEAAEQWQPILHASNQVVLYNPRSHALSIASTTNEAVPGVVVARRQRRDSTVIDSRVIGDTCPYCKQSLPAGFSHYDTEGNVALDADDGADDMEGRWEDVDEVSGDFEGEIEHHNTDPAYHSRASDYFRLLAIANETSSTAGSRRPSVSPNYRVDHDGDWRRSRSNSRRRNHRGRSSERVDTRQSKGAEENRSTKGAFPAEKMAEGYFKMFFQEEYKLGMGANGTVFLCQHVLDGNPLGHFAVKKIAVGESHSYLLKILREVRLLERLHHPNIISYHHAWLETAQFSSFGPKVPTLHVLMQWAEGGSLDDYIDVRLGRKPAHIHMHPILGAGSTFHPSFPGSPASSANELGGDAEATTPTQTQALPKTPRHPRFASTESSPGDAPQQQQQHAASQHDDPHSRSARIRAFRAYQRAPPEEKDRMRREMENTFGTAFPPGSTSGGGPGDSGPGRKEWTAVHLLSAQEVKSLFHDVTEGLAFLHDKSILHLDLKPGNVLLTWDEGRLIPRAMLSDFGTSRDMINSSRAQRSGNTGTLEYAAPESLPSPQTGLLQQIDSKADMWSLGMILHKLLFFKLPYRYAAQGDANGEPISRDDEGEKMTRLEKEVLEYPGFKATPNLVAGFEARRLPRAFLVLLENLLHKSPAGRPSCERVNAAIREGKLDPLEDTTAENLSLARPWGDPSTPPSSIDRPPNIASGSDSDSRRMLALPSSAEVLGVEEGRWRHWLSWTNLTQFLKINFVGSDIRRLRRTRHTSISVRRRWAAVGMKALRSTLLVIKVVTIPRVCPEPMTRPRPWIAVMLLAVALLDTVRDHDDVLEFRPRGRKKEENQRVTVKRYWRLFSRGNLKSVWITLGLTLFHFGILGMSSSWSSGSFLNMGSWWRSVCCVGLDGGR